METNCSVQWNKVFRTVKQTVSHNKNKPFRTMNRRTPAIHKPKEDD